MSNIYSVDFINYDKNQYEVNKILDILLNDCTVNLAKIFCLIFSVHSIWSKGFLNDISHLLFDIWLSLFILEGRLLGAFGKV